MPGEDKDLVVYACDGQKRIDRARLIPVVSQQTPMLAICLQGTTMAGTYWSDVFLYNVDTTQRHVTLPVLLTPREFVAAPGPGIVAGLTFVVPGEMSGLGPESQAVISANTMYPTPVYSFAIPVPAVKKVRFEDAVDLHGLGHPGVALASPNRPPLVRDEKDGWRMLEGSLRPHRLLAARPNILIGVGPTSTGAMAAVAWRINSPFLLHAFGGRKNVTDVAVSTSGDLVAIAGPDGVGIHRVTGEEVTERLPVTGRLDAVLIDDSGASVYVICVTESGITVWDAAYRWAVAELPAVGEPVIEARFAPTVSGSPKVALVTTTRVLVRTLDQ